MTLLDLVSLMQVLRCFALVVCLDMQLIFALHLIALRVWMILYLLNDHCSRSLMIILV